MECGPPRGSPEPQITWRKNGQTMDLTNSKRVRIVDGGNLAIQDTRQTDDGRYQCVVRNIAGVRESSVAFLKVHVKPFLIRGPQNQTSVVGSSVTFQCRVGGEPLPDVLWRRSASGGNMPLGRVQILEDRSLRLDGVTLDDMGEYSCEADNAVGSVTATGTLSVHSPPKFTVRPKTQISEIGKEALFECQASGYPKPTIFWSIEGNRTLMFPGMKYGNVEISITPEGRSVLSISKVQRYDAGKIIVCSAVNSVSSVSSRVVLSLNPQDDRPPPIITLGPTNQTLPLKSVAALPCKSIGSPTPIISWYRDGIPVILSERITLSEDGTLTITDLKKDDDAGLYTCVSSSRSGKSTWSAYLKLEMPTNPNIKFYRAPEPTTFPGQPGKPQIVEKTENGVTIAWTRSNKVGASSLLGYTVEMYGRNDTDGWLPVATRLQNTTYTQIGLTAGISYYFVVRAENKHGLSMPSQLSEPILVGMNEFNIGLDLSEARASLLSGDVVELTNATSTEPTSMKLVWEIINGKYVEGFYIYARQIDSANETYKMLTVLNGGGASTCTVTSLLKYTLYEFFIVPFYKTVEGKPSNSRISRTLEDVPSEPPSHMEALLLNSSAVYLKWKQPAMPAHNGILISYSIIVRGIDINLNKSRVLTNVTIEASTPTLLLANLTEGVTYTVSVAAVNNAGIGPYSSPATLRLDPITKRLDQSSSHRYPINHNHMDDFLTQPWFIALLCTILVVMILTFFAMVFVKRKHMLMKQSALSSIRDDRTNGVLKISSLSRNGNGFWLDTTGMVWRQTEIPKDQIADYAPVCTVPPPHDADTNRCDYSNYPADYAEVSTFRKTPSECSGNRSPAPYATTTLVGGTRLTNFRHNSHHNMYFSNELYPQTNRGVYSESYFNPKDKVNITENKLVNHCNTYNASVSVPQTPIGTIRPNRLKLSRMPNFRISFGDGINQQQQQQQQLSHNHNLQQQQQQPQTTEQQEQLYVKVGETNPPSEVYVNWSQNQNHRSQHQQQPNRYHEKHRKDIDKEMIYAPSGNRSIISYVSANNRFDDV
ncbi:protein sax-3 [Bradysia coprophila]|uniref:protein sax-3 n=1 Tax=Bradysia coprophila TaxID=38358 RepID=UPI00187DDA0F|nr:protein sax-3 [Bradysia coprophila]